MFNTKSFIKALRERVNKVLPTYYEEAPQSKQFPYAIINGVHITDADGCDLALFYIDIWADEKSKDATVQLEGACDSLRNNLTDCVIAESGVFAAHIGFDNQNTIADNEYDLAHRRVSMSARIFYY